MAGRKVFFSFHYELDVWRASIIRNCGIVDASARAGWNDASLWNSVEKKGNAAVRSAIDNGLKGTSVTTVLIGEETANRPWVKYEIEQSIKRGNGLIGIRIDQLRNQTGKKGKRGPIPKALRDYRTYDWNQSSFGRWVEFAAIDAGRPCLKHGNEKCVWCRWMWWW
jgi:hypothetical protein